MDHNRPAGDDWFLEKEASRESLKELFNFIESSLAALDMPAPWRDQMTMALDEALTNIILYAYPAGHKGPVSIRIGRAGDEITAEIVDRGQPFDPTAHPAPDISLPIEQRPIGGLGIHMMRKMVTGLRYYREDGNNHLVLKKTWEGNP
jgi:anti-sigma regulatory factor (Ser/Thr protein kinase)